MKRKKYIFIGILVLAVVLVIGLFAYRYRGVLRSLLHSVRYSQAEIESQLEENHRKVQEITEQHPEITVRDLTEEEKKALRDQSLTQEEAIAILTGKDQEQTPETAQTGSEESVPPEPTQQELYDQQLSELIAESYLMREEFLAKLDEIQERAMEAYRTLPEEKKTPRGLFDFASAYIAEASALEEQCNDRMDLLVYRMDRLIRENNGDPAVLDAVIDAYIQEKSLKKAWYITELQKRGWIQK